MVPGSIYMTLLAGASIGPAAQWVTLILFIEVARRANQHLGKAQVFTLFYISGAIMVTASQLEGGFHGGLGALWSQFYVQLRRRGGPGHRRADPQLGRPQRPGGAGRAQSLFMKEWLPAIGLIAFTMIIGRIDNMILGYGLFRITSDIEKLPFPMAPVGAQGILALTEESEDETDHDEERSDIVAPLSKKDPAGATTSKPGGEAAGGSWRWRIFTMGSIIGLAFGAVYLGVPTVTGALLDEPITLLPIPFVDYTRDTAAILPAVAFAISLDLGQVLFGMVLPFWAMVGTGIGLLTTMLLNPILYAGLPDALPVIGGAGGGVLSSWNPGDNMQQTVYKNNVDFYFSFSLGVAMTIAVAGFVSVFKQLAKARRQRKEDLEAGIEPEKTELPEGRGDIRPWAVIATYVISTALYLGVSCWLLIVTDGRIHPPLIAVMLFYAIVYTPVLSYVTARLEGIAGEVINLPFVREGSFILSGYTGRGGVVPADPDPQLRLDDGLLPPVRADGHEVHEHLEERALAHADHPRGQPVLRALHLEPGPDPRPAVPLRAGVVGGHRREPLAGVLFDAGRFQRVRAGLPRPTTSSRAFSPAGRSSPSCPGRARRSSSPTASSAA